MTGGSGPEQFCLPPVNRQPERAFLSGSEWLYNAGETPEISVSGYLDQQESLTEE
ncbi:hypothetical protein AAJCM20276_30300 [Acetobacter aceti]|uniref:Uncharacterized protein n=1 Tax=Acetobacter aceti TaxID=435 RepID=A0A6S6PNR3_ACEAC|nr:hypothetical protein AAJCM20276_30300 [Acetobacter aceti]